MTCKDCGFPVMARFEDPVVYIAGDGWYCERCNNKKEEEQYASEDDQD